MDAPKAKYCRLVNFVEVSGIFTGKIPTYRTLLNYKKRGIIVADPLTNMIDVEETKRRFLFRRENRTTTPGRRRK